MLFCIHFWEDLGVIKSFVKDHAEKIQLYETKNIAGIHYILNHISNLKTRSFI